MALAVKIDAGEYDPLPAHFSAPFKGFVSSLLTLDRKQRPFVKDILDNKTLEFQSQVTEQRNIAEKAKLRSGEARGKV